MRKSFGLAMLLAALVSAHPALAQEGRFERTVGGWRVGGAKGVCTLIPTDRSGGRFIIVSPDGGNKGGMLVLPETMPTGDSDAYVLLTITVGDGAPTQRDGQISDRPRGVFLDIDTVAEMPKWPDEGRLVISGQGRTLLEASLHGFRAGIALLLECDRVTDTSLVS